MKKNYQKPAIQSVTISIQSLLTDSNPVHSVSSGGVFSNTSAPEGGSGDARSRGFDDWGDE